MFLDPCRRFTFGMTMQGRELRLWFACCGFVLTTKLCDFLKDHARLVHLFISFAFSSRTDFGWDLTITYTDPASNPSDPRKRRVYSIEVRNDQGEVRCATRVWLVRDKQEHEICAQILADTFKHCGAANQATLKRLFLTPYVCGKVFINDGVDTTDGMMHQELPTIPASTSETHPGSLREITTSRKSQMRKSTIQTPRSPVLRHKYHYRIVFTERGNMLFDEKSLFNVYVTLTDILTALHIFHRSGWVHRDISCGNVYYYDQDQDDSRGILGDLEYSRRCDATEAHESRTGTLNFLSTEVMHQRWDYLPLPSLPEDDQTGYHHPPPFAYNPLHDLESCWWLLVCILLHNDDVDNVLEESASVLQRHDMTVSLFTRTVDTASWRESFMKTPGQITIEELGLSPSLAPAVRTISRMAYNLSCAFTSAEASYHTVNIDDDFLKNQVTI